MNRRFRISLGLGSVAAVAGILFGGTGREAGTDFGSLLQTVEREVNPDEAREKEAERGRDEALRLLGSLGWNN